MGRGILLRFVERGMVSEEEVASEGKDQEVVERGGEGVAVGKVEE